MSLTTLLATIPAGSSLSAPLIIPGPNYKLVRIGMPTDGWDGGAPLTFQISPDGVDYCDLFRVVQSADGRWVPYESVVMSVVPNSILFLPPDAGSNLGFLKFRSGTRSKPVNQAADRKFAAVFV